MKRKLFQIFLGAVGSAITVIISHYAGAGTDATVALTALGLGSATALMG